MALITDIKNIYKVLANDERPEQSRSSYWDEEIKNVSISPDGEIIGDSVLGTIAPKSPLRSLFHKSMQIPFLAMAKNFKNLRDLRQKGQHIADKQNRILTLDIVRQVLSLESVVSANLDFSNDGLVNVVIGDGCGIMGSLLMQCMPHRKTVMVNLRKSLLVDLLSIKKTFPDTALSLPQNSQELSQAINDGEINVIGVMADDADLLGSIPIGLVINIVSMQEMPMSVINNYFDIIRKNPSPETYFYCCNRLYKKLYGGEEICFHDYPWLKDDKILFESKAAWNQWYYSKTPPFWHYRFGKDRIIWHRLARMAKKS